MRLNPRAVARSLGGTGVAPETHKRFVGSHVEIAVRYNWLAREARKNAWPAFGPKKYPRGSRPLISRLRLRELERVYVSRYGAHLPCDDAGLEDLEIAAHHIAQIGGDVRGHITGWAADWMPDLPRPQVEALAEKVLSDPRKFKAATLGWRLRLTDQERTVLGITTIAAFDITPAERAACRKRKACERMARWRDRRRMMGPPKPRPLSQTKPWKTLGMSRATWFRKGKPPAVELRETKFVT